VNVVSNTTVLSNFAGADRLDMLAALFGTIFIPTEVQQEIHRGLAEGYEFYRAVESVVRPPVADGWIRLTSLKDPEELSLLADMPGRLHAGEAACLAMAQHRDWLFLTDDKAARKVAAERRVRLSGSLGCLVLGVGRRLWTEEEANGVLASLVQIGFFSPVVDIRELIAE